MTAEKSFVAEHLERPLHAVAVLALMYANKTPPPLATELFFAVGDFDRNFMTTEVSPTDSRSDRRYATLGVDALASAGLLEYTDKVRGRGSRLTRRLRKTDKLAPVNAAYNALYSTLLCEHAEISSATARVRSINVLAAAYYDEQEHVEKNTGAINAVAQLAGISQEHAERRMLTSYATALGVRYKIDSDIEKRIVSHPLAKRQ